MDKEKRIKKELSRISVYFDDVAENQRAIVAPLLQNAAFMKVTLEDLQAEINANGPTDEYQNGANQRGIKQSATLQSYNALIKNYASVIKTLSQLLPPEKKATLTPWEAWQAKRKAEADAEEEEDDEARLRRINAEIKEAADRQRRERENA